MFKPLNNKVFIELIEEAKQTESGIVLPDSHEKDSTKGRIVATGPGKLNEEGKRVEMSIKVGDIVLFEGYGTDVEYEGKKYKVRSEDDILAVIDK